MNGERAGVEGPLMNIEIDDKSLMMIFLLEECNFTCAHCAREDEPMDPGYKLSFEQLQGCLSDCRNLKSINWVHFSGGEPTLWKEGNRDLVDLLLEIADAGYTPGFTSNGSLFVNYSRCRDFFARYFEGSTMPLRLYFSIDTFHKNYNPEKGRARSLDNIIKLKQEFPQAKADLLIISVMITVSKEVDSLLPDEMIDHYESLGIKIGFVPLYPIGRAKSFSHLCPDLDSDNPEELGAYRRYYKKEDRKRPGDAEDRLKTDHIILIGNDYYFSDPWHKVGQLGHLPDEIIGAYAGES
ncbi:MAG: radical SAM protein [Candidatus Zixiibacteriota bacterium]|nr:MAG: radical SAM protein [candidate division Zixibacteria bacterium]